MPLHYLPASQFDRSVHQVIASNAANAKFKSPLAIVKSVSTWPGQTAYLNGEKLSDMKVKVADPNLYRARFVLQRPGFWRFTDRVVDLSDDYGDSHFRIRDTQGRFGPLNTVRLELDKDSNPMIGYANQEGVLQLVEYGPFAAISMEYAEGLATTKVAKALSLLSLRFDSPLMYRQLKIENLATRQIRVLYTVPDWQVSIPALIQSDSPNFLRLCAAFYREALLSSSPLYSFICYYKVITTIHHARRILSLSRQFASERLPDTAEDGVTWLANSFFIDGLTFDDRFMTNLLPEGVRWGMSFAEIVEKIFRPKRHEIAHAFDENKSSTIDPDQPYIAYSLRLMLPLIKVISRYMTRNTFPALLSPSGAINAQDED